MGSGSRDEQPWSEDDEAAARVLWVVVALCGGIGSVLLFVLGASNLLGVLRDGASWSCAAWGALQLALGRAAATTTCSVLRWLSSVKAGRLPER
jgi:hypothetical protein